MHVSYVTSPLSSEVRIHTACHKHNLSTVVCAITSRQGTAFFWCGNGILMENLWWGGGRDSQAGLPETHRESKARCHGNSAKS